MTGKEFVAIYNYQKAVCKIFPTKESELLMEVLDYINQPGNTKGLEYIDHSDIVETAWSKNWKEMMKRKLEGK